MIHIINTTTRAIESPTRSACRFSGDERVSCRSEKSAELLLVDEVAPEEDPLPLTNIKIREIRTVFQ